MRVWREFRLVYPHAVWVLGLAALIAWGSRFLEGMADRSNVPCPISLDRVHLYTLVIAAAFLGIVRIAVHPAFKPAYLGWLRSTPWTYPTRLPLGSVLMSWQDMIVIGVLVALALPGNLVNAAWAASAFIGGYCLGGLIPYLCVRVKLHLVMVVGAVYCAVRYWPDPTLILCTAIALLVVMSLGIRHGLRQFHEVSFGATDSIPNGAMIFSARDDKPKLRIPTNTGRVFTMLHRDKPERMTIAGSVAAFLLCAGIGCGAYVEHPLEIATTATVIVLSLILGFFALLRWAVYRGYAPISLWGRIRTGRLIIPRFDRVLLVPLLIMVGGLGGFWVLHLMDVPARVGFGAAVFLGAVIAFFAGPSHGAHRLTGGQHYLIRPGRWSLALGPQR